MLQKVLTCLDQFILQYIDSDIHQAVIEDVNENLQRHHIAGAETKVKF